MKINDQLKLILKIKRQKTNAFKNYIQNQLSQEKEKTDRKIIKSIDEMKSQHVQNNKIEVLETGTGARQSTVSISDEISHKNDIIKNLMMNTQNTDYFERNKAKLITDKKRFNQVENYY